MSAEKNKKKKTQPLPTHSVGKRGAEPVHDPTAEAGQARAADEDRKAREAADTARERMIHIGRGNQQAGRGRTRTD